MNAPASAIKDEVHQLIESQIQTFRSSTNHIFTTSRISRPLRKTQDALPRTRPDWYARCCGTVACPAESTPLSVRFNGISGSRSRTNPPKKLGIFSSGAPLKTVADLSAVERYFVVLKWKDQVPYLASCARCGHKFFTPNGRFRNDPVGAEEYLRDKYVRHECKTEPKK